MAAFGLLLGTVGGDPMTGTPRFTFGVPSLLDGLEFLPVTIGLFAVAEVLTRRGARSRRRSTPRRSGGSFPAARTGGRAAGLSRGRASSGSSWGCCPVRARPRRRSWRTSRRSASRYPERFGTGVIEGVAAPETANNAASGGALVPLLTLGVPGSGTTAIMLGALMLGSPAGAAPLREEPRASYGASSRACTSATCCC